MTHLLPYPPTLSPSSVQAPSSPAKTSLMLHFGNEKTRTMPSPEAVEEPTTSHWQRFKEGLRNASDALLDRLGSPHSQDAIADRLIKLDEQLEAVEAELTPFTETIDHLLEETYGTETEKRQKEAFLEQNWPHYQNHLRKLKVIHTEALKLLERTQRLHNSLERSVYLTVTSETRQEIQELESALQARNLEELDAAFQKPIELDNDNPKNMPLIN